MKGPTLRPGGEDITWPDQVAPRGRKASSTRHLKPQTSNLAVLFAWPGLVLCWCVAPLMVGFPALVRGPPEGRACCVGAPPPKKKGACCVGVWPLPRWGMLCWCVARLMVGRAAILSGPPHGGACFVAACPPRWLCVVWWCLGWVVVV